MLRKSNESLDKIRFGILSANDIIKMSVVEVKTVNNDENGLPTNTISDPRMGFNGISDNKCKTCNQDYKSCPGHFGHLNLNRYVFNPIFLKDIISFLKIICHSCGKVLLEDSLSQLPKIDSEESLKSLISLCEKKKRCFSCKHVNPHIQYNLSQQTISFSDGNSDSVRMSPKEIYDILSKTKDNTISNLGLDPSMFHPSSLILSVLPIMPPCARPSVSDDTQVCDDDLSGCLNEIIKINNELDNTKGGKKKHDKDKIFHKLKEHISILFNNSSGKKTRPTTGRPIKGISDRLKGKEGRIRRNIMGKRVDFSARTVISPDPNLEFGEVGIPRQVANILTFPERVTSFNKQWLTQIVNDGKALTYERKNKDDKLETYQIKTKQYTHLPEKNTKMNKYVMLQGFTKDSIIKIKKKKIKLETNDVVIFLNTKTQNIIIVPSTEYKIFSKKKHNILPVIIKNGYQKSEDILQLRDHPGYKANDNDFIIRYTNKKDGWKIQINKRKKRIELNIGDIVNRFLIDGDMVLLNRQPTLHKGSMMAKKVKIFDSGKTFRLSLESTKSFNADFDGDEMNIHVPQSYSTRVEMKEIAASKHNLISDQGSSPNIAIVQDSLSSAYLMTTLNIEVKEEEFFDQMMDIVLDKQIVSQEILNEKYILYHSLIQVQYNDMSKSIYTIYDTINYLIEESKIVMKTIANDNNIYTKQLKKFDPLFENLKELYDVKDDISNVNILFFKNPDTFFLSDIKLEKQDIYNELKIIMKHFPKMQSPPMHNDELHVVIDKCKSHIMTKMDSDLSIEQIEMIINNIKKLENRLFNIVSKHMQKIDMILEQIHIPSLYNKKLHISVENITLRRLQYDRNQLFLLISKQQLIQQKKKHDKPVLHNKVYSTNLLLSMILPKTFTFKKETLHYPSISLNIKDGILLSGYMDKSSLGSSRNSIIQMLSHLYDKDITSEFITNIQKVTNKWIRSYGFSMGIQNVIVQDEAQLDKIKKALKEAFIRADGYEKYIINDSICESKQLKALEDAKKEQMDIVQKTIKENNYFKIAVWSGAKGTKTNLYQTQASIGQQHVKVGRIPLQLDGKRSLPHYPLDRKELSLQEKYESRGFISNSLTSGLNPQEFFFYAMAGRENICDTAMGTPLSGYIQRRLVKVMEDFQIMWDNTVRDASNGDIIQLSYGDNSIACNKLIKANGSLQMMNIDSINNLISTEHELYMKQQKLKTQTQQTTMISTNPSGLDVKTSIVTVLDPTESKVLIPKVSSTLPKLTPYEISKIKQIRSEMLINGVKPLIKVPDGITRADEIVDLEFQQNKIPFNIARKLVNGKKIMINFLNDSSIVEEHSISV